MLGDVAQVFIEEVSRLWKIYFDADEGRDRGETSVEPIRRDRINYSHVNTERSCQSAMSEESSMASSRLSSHVMCSKNNARNFTSRLKAPKIREHAGETMSSKKPFTAMIALPVRSNPMTEEQVKNDSPTCDDKHQVQPKLAFRVCSASERDP